MSGRSPHSLTSIPGFDPRQVPIEQLGDPAPAVPLEALVADALRQRFQAPPVWQPEFTSDPFRFRQGEPRAAAVLVPIVIHHAAPTVLLTERTAHLRGHAGQVAFPGGGRDPDDSSAIATALRETEEEIGVVSGSIEVIGQLPEYLTGTGYRITPVVGLVQPDLTLRLDSFEVAEAFEVPLAFLMDPRHHERRRVRLESGERVFYSMPYRSSDTGREYFIWGATAAMLRNLYRFLSTPTGS